LHYQRLSKSNYMIVQTCDVLFSKKKQTCDVLNNFVFHVLFGFIYISRFNILDGRESNV
jgi:hypothetical protein